MLCFTNLSSIRLFLTLSFEILDYGIKFYKYKILLIDLPIQNLGCLFGGPHSTMDSVLASHPAAPGWNPGIPKVLSENFLDVNCCQVNQQHCCLEQWTAEA